MFADVKVCRQRPSYRETNFFEFRCHVSEKMRYFWNGKTLNHIVFRHCLRMHDHVWPQSFQMQWFQVSSCSSIKHEIRSPLRRSPKNFIECRAWPAMFQVRIVLGHRYETCTLVFYRGALMGPYSIEKMVLKKMCAPQFYRGCFEGVTCAPGIYI